MGCGLLGYVDSGKEEGFVICQELGKADRGDG